jgi:hypothetical protein
MQISLVRMIFRVAFLSFCLIGATTLCLGADPRNEVNLEPGVTFCGHISAASSEFHAAIIEPYAPSVSFVLRWRNSGNELGLVLASPGGREINSSSETSAVFVRDNKSLSVVLPAPEAGIWSAKVTSGSKIGQGEDYCLSFKPARLGELSKTETTEARFNGLYQDYGVDWDGNGLYEEIVIKAGINVRNPGIYSLMGQFSNINDGTEIPVQNRSYLNFGSKALVLTLYGMTAPGPYRLISLTLYDDSWNVIDEVDESAAAFTTQEYQDLEIKMRGARLNGNYSDYGSDINGDGYYDYLTTDAGIEVFLPGNYSLMGFLCDSRGKELVWSMGFGYFLPGIHTMHIDFDGKSLRQKQINGPYTLCNLSLSRGDSVQENLSTEDIAMMGYETKPYSYTQFVDPV